MCTSNILKPVDADVLQDPDDEPIDDLNQGNDAETKKESKKASHIGNKTC